jgi:hypothetical protein
LEDKEDIIMDIIYKIAKEFTDTPGPRLIVEGKFSGEMFLKDVLLPKYKEAIKSDSNLVIDLDGTFGYPPSFLDEAFGGLIKETQTGTSKIFKNLIIKSSRKHYIDTIITRMRAWEELYIK